MNHLVTFASIDMVQSALLCELSAKVHGADSSAIWNPHMLTDAGFYRNAIEEVVMSGRRGCNYWQWKPYVIAREMISLPDGSIVIYADAGVEFIDNVNYIIDRMDQDIFLFGNMYEHAHWCKRDIVEAIFPSENPPYMSNKNWSEFGKQVQASVIFFRVSDYSRQFVAEWLKFCLAGHTDSFPPFETRYLIDDSPSFTPNHPEFQENRHDQAILTTMAYRDGLPLHWWGAEYNDGTFTYPRGDYPDEGYPVLFNHHRKRNNEWSVAA